MSPALLDTVLAGLNVETSLREAITGDLIEEHARLAAARGERNAKRWTRRQVLWSIPLFVASAIRTGGIRLVAAMIGAALSALLVTGVLIGVSTRLWYTLWPQSLEHVVIAAVIIDLAFGVAGGYLAARFGRAAPLGAALVFGIIGLSLTLILGVGMPGAYRSALVLLLVPATLGGGWLRARSLARHDSALST